MSVSEILMAISIVVGVANLSVDIIALIIKIKELMKKPPQDGSLDDGSNK